VQPTWTGTRSDSVRPGCRCDPLKARLLSDMRAQRFQGHGHGQEDVDAGLQASVTLLGAG